MENKTAEEKALLSRIEREKWEKQRAANQVRLTLTQAQGREEWQDRWTELQAYAGKTAMTYCARRLKDFTLDQIRQVRDEALSEAWRMVCDGESAERAIVKAVDQLTHTQQKHREQSRPLPELANHSQEYLASEDNIRELVAALPAKLRPYAVILSAGEYSNYDLAELLDVSEATARRARQELARRLGSRFGYCLLAQWEIPAARRIA